MNSEFFKVFGAYVLSFCAERPPLPLLLCFKFFLKVDFISQFEVKERKREFSLFCPSFISFLRYSSNKILNL